VASNENSADPSVLQEISEFRGRILYADGKRPKFKQDDGGYADDDHLDSRSFHVTARAEGELVGYVRIRPFQEYSQCTLRWLVTQRQLDAILDETRLTSNDCLEISRWIVAPPARGTEVASMLVISCWAVGMWMGKRCLLSAVGLRHGQATMLGRFG